MTGLGLEPSGWEPGDPPFPVKLPLPGVLRSQASAPSSDLFGGLLPLFTLGFGTR